ncbi:MAG: hypothetical protein KAW14_00895 [Candidatus Aegiribacteria sp.]|nr:hypothetical protein [Candidatus Aegiribacteria sp.]
MKHVLWTALIFSGMAALLVLACGGGEPEEQGEPAGETEGEIEEQEESAETPDEVLEGEGDTAVDAIMLGEGVTEGILELEETDDWYVFSVNGGETFSVSFTPSNEAEGINVGILDGELDDMWTEWDVKPPVCKEFSYMTPEDFSGDYYVHVFQGSPGGYTLELSKVMQNDGMSGADAGEQAPNALEIALGETVEGIIGDLDESDWYSFEVPSGSILEISFAPGNDSEGANIAFLDTEVDDIWTEWDISAGVTLTRSMIMNGSSGGIYYISVFKGGTGTYSLTVNAVTQDDAGSGDDAGDRAVYAVALETGQTISSIIGDYDIEDWYSVEVDEGQNLTFMVTPDADGAGLNVGLFDPDQDEIHTEWDVAPGVTCELGLPDDAVAGTYYLSVFSGGTVSYSVLIEEI